MPYAALKLIQIQVRRRIFGLVATDQMPYAALKLGHKEPELLMAQGCNRSNAVRGIETLCFCLFVLWPLCCNRSNAVRGIETLQVRASLIFTLRLQQIKCRTRHWNFGGGKSESTTKLQQIKCRTRHWNCTCKPFYPFGHRCNRSNAVRGIETQAGTNDGKGGGGCNRSNAVRGIETSALHSTNTSFISLQQIKCRTRHWNQNISLGNSHTPSCNRSNAVRGIETSNQDLLSW